MSIPKRDYYPLPLAASIIGCTTDDLIHLAANGKTRLGVLFHADCFTEEEVSFADGSPDGNVIDVRGFAYLERRCMEHFEQIGQCIFNEVEMLDGRRVGIAGTRGRVSRPEDVFIHSVDLEAMLEDVGSAPKPIPTDQGDHISTDLALMNRAAVEFWSTADRDAPATHPNNAGVSAWLQNQGLSKSAADNAASLIRPKWAAMGRKPGE